MMVKGKEYTVEEAKPESFENIDIALFAGGSISKTLAPEAAKRGAVVIDNSSTFRMDPEVPLVIPEINPEDIAKHKGIIANPNCFWMKRQPLRRGRPMNRKSFLLPACLSIIRLLTM